MYGVPYSQLAKLDKEQFKRDWAHYIRSKSDIQKRAADAEFDTYAIPAMYAMSGLSGVGIPYPDCSLGGGFGFII